MTKSIDIAETLVADADALDDDLVFDKKGRRLVVKDDEEDADEAEVEKP